MSRCDRVVKPMGLESTRDFTPSMDYRHLLSPDVLERLLDRESKRSESDARAERTWEIERMSGKAARAAMEKRKK